MRWRRDGALCHSEHACPPGLCPVSQTADASLVAPLLIFSPVFTLLISAITLGEIPDARRLAFVLLAGLLLIARLTPLAWRHARFASLKPQRCEWLLPTLIAGIAPVWVYYLQPRSRRVRSDSISIERCIHRDMGRMAVRREGGRGTGFRPRR